MTLWEWFFHLYLSNSSVTTQQTLPHFLRFSRTIARVTLLQLHFDCGDPPRYQCLKPYNFNISFNCQPKNGDSPVNKATGSLCQSCFISHSLQCISQTQWNLRQGVYPFSKELLIAIASYHIYIYVYKYINKSYKQKIPMTTMKHKKKQFFWWNPQFCCPLKVLRSFWPETRRVDADRELAQELCVPPGSWNSTMYCIILLFCYSIWCDHKYG